MTKTQYNMAADLGLILEGSTGKTESSDLDDPTEVRESIEQHKQSGGTS